MKAALWLTHWQYLMLDVVVNHFGWNGDPASVDYSTFVPFNSSSQYHPYCPINFDDISNSTQLEQCWMGDTSVSLPDLRTEDEDVATQWNDWIADIVSTYSIDGLRLDSAIEVNPSFWQGFGDVAGVYFVGETYNGGVDYVCGFQNVMPGVMDYPTYYPLLAAFSSTPASDDTLMANLADTINAVKGSCKDTSIKGTFTENHDRPRIAHLNPDISAARNVIAYTLLADGIPIIYQGQEQHYTSIGGAEDPYNREALWLSGYNTSSPLYELIATLNAGRKAAIADDEGYLTYRNWPIYTDTTTMAMRKGSMITILSNKGEDGDAYEQVIPAGYPAGAQVTEVLTCASLTADGDGAITVPMEGGLPRVYYPSAGLEGSGICAGGDSAAARDQASSGSGRAKRHSRRHHMKRHLRWDS